MFVSRNLVAGLGLLAASTLGAGSATAAPVNNAYVTTSLHLRAGPGTYYPVVTTMRAGDRVSIYGCLSGWTWCDIGWHGYRGWAAGRYLQVAYHDRRRPVYSYGPYLGLPFLSFSIGPYWNEHYRHRRFYGERSRYDHHHRGNNNPPPHKGQAPHKGRPPHVEQQLNKTPPPYVGRQPKGPSIHMGQPPRKGPPHVCQAASQRPAAGRPAAEGVEPARTAASQRSTERPQVQAVAENGEWRLPLGSQRKRRPQLAGRL